MKFLWKNIGTRVWFLVSVITMVIVFTVSLVATQVPFLRETISIVLGRQRPIFGEENDEKLYEADYKNKAEVFAAAKNFNVQIEEEGIVLLKNENSALPLAKKSKISVFGKNSMNMVYGGTGSGGAASSDTIDLYNSLNAAEFQVNPALKNFYANSSGGRPSNPDIGETISGFPVGETPVETYTQAVKDSYSAYHDAAVVVLSRISGEGFDLPRTMIDDKGNKISGAKNETDHYLQLDQNETDMLNHVCQNFDKVILMLNTSTAMELGFLDDSAYSNIKSVVWVGFPGSTGASAIGRVLNGDINPSGRTTNTYARDFKKDPTWQNFGDNRTSNGNRYTVNGANQNAYFVDYEESIYVGYRYYETRGFEMGGNWYRENVMYPFGHGLSYTTFDWEIVSSSPVADTQLTADGEIKVTVRVKNTGLVPGKEVVQLYFTAPYTKNGIEKSYVVLGAFEKTKMIEPGDYDDVVLSMKVYDMASYDENDKNGNAFKGYEVEGGNYQIKLMKDSHDVKRNAESTELEINYTVPNGGFSYGKDLTTNNDVVNRFTTVSEHIGTCFSRSDFSNENPASFPTVPTAEDRNVSQSLIDSMGYDGVDEGKPWYSTENFKQKKNVTTMFVDLIGVDYDDPIWDAVLDQLTAKEMAELVASGSFKTVDIERIGKPMTIDSDGPSGLTNFMAVGGQKNVYDTCAYVSECVVGATWNKELAYEMGKMVGNESLIGDERQGGMPYSGWYAPAVNLYRSPFSGRNWEYYGEDGLLSGQMGAQVVIGAKEKGVYTFVKHFALNDQETNRDTNGLITWANEQSMREIYFKPFEIIVKEGKTTGVMSSFNRIGTTWAGGCYELLTEVLRDEWGFQGMVITDYAVNSYLNAEQMIRAGGDVLLLQLNPKRVPNYNNASSTQMAALRRATKNILYTTANSNLANVNVIGYKLPVWIVSVIWVNVGLFVGFAAWGFFAIKKAYKKLKTTKPSTDIA